MGNISADLSKYAYFGDSGTRLVLKFKSFGHLKTPTLRSSSNSNCIIAFGNCEDNLIVSKIAESVNINILFMIYIWYTSLNNRINFPC